MLVLSGEGDVVEPEDDTVGIGSGAGYAQALLLCSDLPAVEIARTSMEIAAGLCLYTNSHISVISLEEPCT